MKSDGLDSILIGDLVKGTPMIYHKMMQFSTFSYLGNKHDIYFARGEFYLPYAEKPGKNSTKSSEARWAADLVLKYVENGRSIYEIVEVETIHVSNIRRRVKNIMKKGEIVGGILSYDDSKFHGRRKHSHLYTHLSGVDEVRFSVAIDGRYMQQPYLDDSIEIARNQLSGLSIDGANVHNLYVVTGNLFDYCRNADDKTLLTNYNESMKSAWVSPMERTLYSLRSEFGSMDLDSIYLSVPMKSGGKKPI